MDNPAQNTQDPTQSNLSPATVPVPQTAVGTTPPASTIEEVNISTGGAMPNGMPTMDSDVPPPPPIVNGQATSASGSSFVPTKPKGFGPGKIIATMFGILLLLGGIGGGVYLTQQPKETTTPRASCPCGDSNRCYEPGDWWRDTNGDGIGDDCDWAANYYCLPDTCVNAPPGGTLAPAPPPTWACICDRDHQGACTENCSQVPAGTECQPMADELCKQVQIDISATNPSLGNEGLADWTLCSPKPDCGTTTTATTPPVTPTAPPNVTAQCVEIKAYDANWNQLTNVQLSQLQAGDIVRFTTRGTTSQGVFDRARFTINGTLRPEVTSLRPSTTDEYYDEYTIPEGVTNFTLSSEVHHVGQNQWY